MDFDDDIDGLLDMEADLHEGTVLSKSSTLDKRSQEDVAAVFGSSPKRIRKNAEENDQELLELAARVPLSQHLNPENKISNHLNRLPNTDEELLELAANAPSQQHHTSLPAKKPGAGAPRQQPQTEDEDLDLLLDMEEPAQNKNPAAPSKEKNNPQSSDIPHEDQQQPSHVFPIREYIPPQKDAINVNGRYLTITSQSGVRVYSHILQTDASIHSQSDVASALRRARGGLLSTRIDDLLSEIEKDQFERALQETTTAGQQQLRDGDNTTTLTTTTTNDNNEDAHINESLEKKKHASSLWVDRYAPSQFMDLLSDEQINRDVVHWLKCWDPLVFNKKSAAAAHGASMTASSSKQSKWQGGTKNARASRYGSNTTNNNNSNAAKKIDIRSDDPLQRPEQKVILLCGPPGLGKTTLAHVVARHCGYRPVEINASDDRNGPALMSRIIDAVEMRSVMGEHRPNCVIIDEIDGVAGSNGGGGEGQGAIHALLKIVNATGHRGSKGAGKNAMDDIAQDINGDDSDSDHDDNDAGGAVTARKNKSGGIIRKNIAKSPPARSRRSFGGNTPSNGKNTNNNNNHPAAAGTGSNSGHAKQTLRPLMRPIICICNDVYAPVLRPLREVARVFHFRRPSADKLAHRLHLICSAEGLRVEKSTLRMLAERAECDVRSCLNTLQFLAKRQKWVRQSDLSGLGLGQKDMTKGAFQVWGELLQKKKAPTIIGRAAESESQRHTRLYNMLLDFGEHDLVFGGIHDNLPQLRFFDMALQRTNRVFSNLEDADTYLCRAAKTGDFSLIKYLPATALSLSSYVAGPEKPNIHWPRGFSAVRRRHAANKAVMHQWLLSMSPMMYCALGSPASTLDILPMIPHISTPSLRPVSRYLYSKDEQEQVDRLIGALLPLGIKYSMNIEMHSLSFDDTDGVFPRPKEMDAGKSHVATTMEPPLQFKPPIHRLWTFHGMSGDAGACHRTLPMATRQMLLHEVEMEAIRRNDAARRDGIGDGGDDVRHQEERQKEEEQEKQQQQQQQRTAGHVPLDLAQRLREAGVVASSLKEEKPTTWLDQMREKQHALRAEASGMRTKCRSVTDILPVLYKYNEGYTNAVKRPVKMSELL